MSTGITDTQVPRSGTIPSDCRTTIHPCNEQFDCSTRGIRRLATGQPESEPILVLAQGELNPRFELIQR